MQDTSLRVALLFGGQSGEHEVSVNSAKSVLQAIDRGKYGVETVWIAQNGRWYWGITPDQVLKQGVGASAPGEFGRDGVQVTLVHDPENPHFMALDRRELPNGGRVNLVFPVLHGPFGEDGTLQGLLEMANLPYVGSGVLGSALGMDKDRMKAVFAQAGLPLAHYLTFLRAEIRRDAEGCIHRIAENLGFPCFVKPANLGSSVGISKAHDNLELRRSLELAAIYDRKIVVEENIRGREIEVSVLGNDEARASLPGEILPAREFYDYEAKYQDSASRLLIPAPLSPALQADLQATAVKAFRAVDASGLGRVDFFVTADDKIVLNEINTMPGFTQISMYAKLWEATGIPYGELVDRLITLGLERFRDTRNRKIARV
ncbi:D-Alanine-D-alanine ligase [Acididesulfobacillus acetoxydans]|uniref:D-alanine--D-alanine ligase n=1 Tax=Acididesulfobacillus acetoxydans TaxID=1561005 RepID=A0A8S0VXI6_9FIRM|nr:D-alanine--D-alanine ligase family protein [Acididesulfobacillus acetoxydans]CAA7601943.1 D-Alanine-D-alanine ligase [Acididesulfobacillus acetoxydans]CEJ08213.1 D-alanine--D-alanine ligase [Acididesulfobacillus acetoxydans]